MQSMFNCTMGLLAGCSILHSTIIIGLGGWSDTEDFLKLYPQFAILINFMFLLLGNIAFVLGITMGLIYQARLEEKQRTLDENRDEFRSKRNIATVLSIICGINFLALLFLPKWTSTIFYKGDEMKDK